MSDFQRSLAFVLGQEGGLSDHQLDHGGKTNYGITQMTYDAWRLGDGLQARDVSEITKDEAEAIYQKFYWWVGAPEPWPLNLVLFDSAVLFGPRRAADWLAAVSWHDGPPAHQAWAVLCLRRLRHIDRVAKEPAQRVFMKGWMNRLSALADVVRGVK